MKERLIGFGYAAGWRVVRALPLPVARALFNAAADRGFKGNGPGTQRLRRNLRQVVGPELPDAELEKLVKAGLRSYSRYWMEAFRLPSRSRAQAMNDFRIEPEAEFHSVLGQGKGMIVALPHLANWDVAGAWAVAHGYKLVTVAERLKPEAVFEQFLAYREKLGMEVIPLTGGQRAPLDTLAERAIQGYAVVLLADRDLSARGVEVRFFGARTRMPLGPALLAIRTGAPLYVCNLRFTDTQTVGTLHRIALPDESEGALDARIKTVTQRIADAFEIGIAAHPQDWHMLQKMWLDQPARV